MVLWSGPILGHLARPYPCNVLPHAQCCMWVFFCSDDLRRAQQQQQRAGQRLGDQRTFRCGSVLGFGCCFMWFTCGRRACGPVVLCCTRQLRYTTVTGTSSYLTVTFQSGPGAASSSCGLCMYFTGTNSTGSAASNSRKLNMSFPATSSTASSSPIPASGYDDDKNDDGTGPVQRGLVIIISVIGAIAGLCCLGCCCWCCHKCPWCRELRVAWHETSVLHTASVSMPTVTAGSGDFNLDAIHPSRAASAPAYGAQPGDLRVLPAAAAAVVGGSSGTDGATVPPMARPASCVGRVVVPGPGPVGLAPPGPGMANVMPEAIGVMDELRPGFSSSMAEEEHVHLALIALASSHTEALVRSRLEDVGDSLTRLRLAVERYVHWPRCTTYGILLRRECH